MTKQAIVAAALAAAMSVSAVAVTRDAQADSIFNPFSWFFGSDHDDDYYYGHHWYGPYAWGWPYGAYGPWGYPGYARRQTVIVVANDSSDESARPPQ